MRYSSRAGDSTSLKIPDRERASSIRFKGDKIEIELSDGRIVLAPLTFYPTLLKASPRRRKGYRFFADHTAVEWEDLDLQFEIRDFVEGRKEVVSPSGFRDWVRERMIEAGLPPLPKLPRD